LAIITIALCAVIRIGPARVSVIRRQVYRDPVYWARA
jgi:hypothetical protein